MPIIEVSSLSKTYISYKKSPGFIASVKGLFNREEIRVEAVKNISFTIDEGELVGFLGPNGAGKTTTLKMLSGILTPTFGNMLVHGYDPSKRNPTLQKQFSLVMGQKNQLWWDLPASDSFELNREIYEIPATDFESRKTELVDLLGVHKLLDVPIRKLSLGERMKMELIGALLHGPKVLFLDEPTIGLDIISQEEIRKFLRKHNEEAKTTIVLTSHYMKDVEALCRRIIVMNEGVIVYDDDLSTLSRQYADVKIVKVTLRHGEPARLAESRQVEPSFNHLRMAGYKILEQKEDSISFEIKRSEIKEKTSEILSSLPVEDILIEDVPVEEVVRHIFTKH